MLSCLIVRLISSVLEPTPRIRGGHLQHHRLPRDSCHSCKALRMWASDDISENQSGSERHLSRSSGAGLVERYSITLSVSKCEELNGAMWSDLGLTWS